MGASGFFCISAQKKLALAEKVFLSRGFLCSRAWNTSSRTWYICSKAWNICFRAWNTKISPRKKLFLLGVRKKNCGKWKEALLRSIPNWDNKVSQINIGLIEERKTSLFFTFPGCFSTLRLRLSTYGAQEVANLCAEHFSLFTLFCTFAPNIT